MKQSSSRLVAPWIAAVFLGLVALPAARPQVIAREGKGSLERVEGRLLLRVKGTPFEMGFQHGRLLKDMIRTTVERVIDNKDKVSKKPEYTLYKVLRGIMHTRLLPHVPKNLIEEMKGLSEGSGVPMDDLVAANLFPEAFHCTGAALHGKATHDGSLYHVRILDYMTDIGLQETAIIVIAEPEGRRAWLNVGFAGFTGSVTGMNDKGITIGEMGGGGVGRFDGTPMAFLIREALERASNLGEAEAVFRDAKRTCEYYYVISDPNVPDAIGIHATPKRFDVVKPGETYAFVEVPEGMPDDVEPDKVCLTGVRLKQSDHVIEFKGKGFKGVFAKQPEDTVLISGADRFQCFAERLAKVHGSVDEKALMEIVLRPVSMKSNLHTAIFHPGTREVWVAVAAKDGSPACDQPYTRFTLDGGAKDSAATNGR
jgi:hypothetical protein